MQFLHNKKNIALIVTALVLALGAYFYFKSSDVSVEDASSLVYTTGPAAEDAFIGNTILSALNDLRRLKLDGSVFANPVFQSLVDYRVATTSEPLGRSDPFAPLPKPPKTKTAK